METQAATPSINIANRRLVKRLLLITVAMFGFGFLMVPIYDVVCQVTGLNGKTGGRVAADELSAAVDEARTVTVEFVASLNVGAPWEFKPQVSHMQVHPGQYYQTHYFARNLTSHPLVAQAVPSVTPGLAARHFQKIECFCFTRQKFQPGEGREMPVTFRIDSDLPPDVHTVTLSYTFFRLDDEGS